MCRLLLDDNLMIYPLTPQLLIGSNLQIEKKVFSRKAVTQRLYYYHRPPPLCCVKLNFPLTLCKKELAAENVVVHSLY